MKTFDILQPSLDLHQHYFVEASAGCGKTFSIENIVTRLIMDNKQPFDIERILVLTFTKEATSELKARIRKNIEAVIDQLENPKSGDFEYVQEFAKEGEEKKAKAIQSLQEALAKFDLAQIFTIHKFCFIKLKQFLFEAKLSLSEEPLESSLSMKTYEKVVRDFLGFNLNPNIFSKSQLKVLLSFYKNDFGALLQAIVYQLAKEISVGRTRKWKDICLDLEEERSKIFQEYAMDTQEIAALYEKAAPLFKGSTNREKEVSKEVLNTIFKLSLFISNQKLDEFVEVYPTFRKIFENENLKKSALKKIDENTLFFRFHKRVTEKLFPLLDESTKKENLLASLCFESQKLLNIYFEKNKILTPSNILTKFNDLIDQKGVALSIRAGYQAVIVDEFQDTDPTQWQILSKIFLKNISKKIPFYLVGDPKQSIYAFRQADIYTYLKAAQMLGVQDVSTLNTNYRSQPGLIDALNALFTKKKDKWLTLPRLQSSLTYHPIQSFEGIKKTDFKDERSSIHFILAEQKEKMAQIPSKQLEENILFPFFANEILRLHHEFKMPFRSFAILVRDRFQAARLKDFLKKHHLPFMSTRPESLQGLPTIEAFLQIYLAVLHPKTFRYIFALKINSILQLPNEMFDENAASLFDYFSSLKELLFKRGFLAFYQVLMNEPSLFEQPIYGHTLSNDGGLYTYLELEQLKDLLLQEEIKGGDPYHLLQVLEDLSTPTALPEKVHPLRQNFEEDGLQLLTLHMSKGLEFEVVFALGLINQVKSREELIFDPKKNELKAPFLFSKEDLAEYQEELDAEKMRQLYVAMTRAKQRLYLPCILPEKERKNLTPSPMESFLNHIDLCSEGLKSFISGHQEMSYTFCKEEIKVTNYHRGDSICLTKPRSLEKNFHKESKHSFTSLASPHQSAFATLKAPSDFSNIDKTIHTLPAGPETGLLFHRILEKICFRENNLKIDEFIAESKYEPWKEVIESTLFKLLNATIQTPTFSFSLGDLKKNQVQKEIEFLYPIKGDEKIEEMVVMGDYMQGFIDLLCLYNGKYFLIDYKTNWLGGNSHSYRDLKCAMNHNQYFLQAKIYREALKKYIHLFDKREFKECFGGTLYWFIRGLDDKRQGIYFIDP